MDVIDEVINELEQEINKDIQASEDIEQLLNSINAPSDMALFKYSSVNITLAAQFGISPIRLVINGDNILFVSNILDRYFSPNKVKIVFIIKVIMNINKVICNVCFIADNMML